MLATWINPKIITGNSATGTYYYNRQQIVSNIWEEIEKGNHVLLAAPRRVGKTSVMKYMTRICPEGYRCIFEVVQGVDSENRFYKTLYELIKSCLGTRQKTLAWFQEIIKETKIEEIGKEGVKLGDRSINYLEVLDTILPKLRTIEEKIVLFIDELPEVLHNLSKKNKKEEALSILKNLRRWRQDDQYQNFCLVLAGSIGIHHVVKMITGRTSDTNDFSIVDFEALSQEEAHDYIAWATSNDATIQYNQALKDFLISKIQYCLPYFINLMLAEINKNAQKKQSTSITTADIEEAFNYLVKKNDHFREWKSRLFDYMPREEAEFLHEVLTYTAHHDFITKQKIYDLALQHHQQNFYMDLIDGLERDGYLVEAQEIYVFISPFLKAFWKQNNPIVYGKRSSKKKRSID